VEETWGAWENQWPIVSAWENQWPVVSAWENQWPVVSAWENQWPVVSAWQTLLEHCNTVYKWQLLIKGTISGSLECP
jgi:hypothetical protein